MNKPSVQIEDLAIGLSGNAILHGVSLDVNEGEYASIIGPNGAGKSTLIKCLAGIHDGWSGSIRFNGRPFSDFSPRERAKTFAYVPQAEGRANPLTVEEFVATGRYPHLSAFTTMRSEDFAAINREIERAGLTELRHRSLATLSGGERQMAFIAAALAQDTQIILLDEPSTFLDYRHQSEVGAILRSASRENGATIIAVHHDINTAAASSDHIHALKNGQLVFSGTPAETVNAEVLERVFDTPFQITPSPHRAIPLVTAGGDA